MIPPAQDSFIYLTCKPEASVVQDNWRRALGTRNSGERQWLSSTKFVIVGLGVSQEMSFATHSLKKFYGQVQNTEHHIPYSHLDFFSGILIKSGKFGVPPPKD